MRHLGQVILLTMVLLGVSPVYAQQVQQKGNNFSQVTTKERSKETKTQYTYTDSKGVTYPIYLSSTGKAFIKKKSKKTGKEYKQYLPEVGKKINPKAYSNTNSKHSTK